MKKRDFLKLSAAATAGLAFDAAPGAFAQSTPGTLRVAMTAADVPLTTGQPNQGAEGVRFMGITVYDGLTRWDLSKSDVAAKIVPDLAESWSVSETDKRVWTFKLRHGVRFHDGSAFNADAVVWNLDKLLSRNAPQFDATQAAQGGLYTGGIASWRKIDDNTVEITTKVIDAVLPYSLASVFMSSPAQYEKVGRDWTKFAEHPSGTGPWKLDSFKPRERADLVRNPDYWDKARIPKCERLILFPIPEANTRVAALLSGRVDWVEAPPPDAIARLKQQKMQIVTNLYPHVWPYMAELRGGIALPRHPRAQGREHGDRPPGTRHAPGRSGGARREAWSIPAIPGSEIFDDGPQLESRRREEAPRGSGLRRKATRSR